MKDFIENDRIRELEDQKSNIKISKQSYYEYKNEGLYGK